MDLDVAKMVIGFLTGLLIFAGAVLSFVNSRLNEAKTTEGRSQVVNTTLLWLSVGFVIVSFAGPYFRLPLLWVLPSLASIGLQLVVFLRSTAPVTRLAVVMIALDAALGALVIGLATTIFFVGLLTDLHSRTIDALGEIAKVVGPSRTAPPAIQP